MSHQEMAAIGENESVIVGVEAIEDRNSIKKYSQTQHNVNRREKRAKERVKRLMTVLREYKRTNNRQEEQIHKLSIVVENYKTVLSERNSEVKHLKSLVKRLEQENDVLQCEIDNICREKKEDQDVNDAIISDLKEENCRSSTKMMLNWKRFRLALIVLL